MSHVLRNAHQQFSRDNRGNVAMLFGLMAVPVMGLIGLSIDYGRAVKAQHEMQALLDGAAVAAAAEYSKTGDAGAATERLRSTVAEGLRKQNLNLLPQPVEGEPAPKLSDQLHAALLENAEFDTGTSTVHPKLSARIQTTITSIIGQDYFDVEATSTAGLAGKKLELAMMLDITGSMCDDTNNTPCSNGRKLDAMKNAAKDLVSIVFQGNGANTRMSVVPFSSAVNVGTISASVTNQPSTTQQAYACGNRNRSTCYRTLYRTDCVAERTGSSKFVDNAPSSGNYSTALWTSNSNRSCTPAATATILPLTGSRDSIESKITGLKGQGGTAGHIGTAWAWYTISEKWASFWGTSSAPEPVGPTLLKAAVLMTDGDYNSCQGGQSCSTSDNDAITFCNNMKTQGIRVFTVGFEIDDDNARDTLIACASPGDYHFPYNGEEMREVFRSIGNALVAGTAGPVLSN